ncbi:SixA phosphatase family protein [Aquimarina sp. 2-A2]|uniref:SixA phosphatase family protein n=1 Tax=Aquimarina sp. 2-A2 TaxID=3382644 RepID=UPI00387F016B
MKKLILIRHAKSSWKFDVTDHQRPLKKRGKNDAKLIGKRLRKLGITADKIICSDAKRTQMTAAIILDELEIKNTDFSLDHALYDFEGTHVFESIIATNAEIDTLMVFGHNYALTALANTLGDQVIDNIPTAGVVIIEFANKRWSSISVGKTLLTLFPKELR